MATSPVVKFKRSVVSGRVPTTAMVPEGELGINLTDKKVYINLGEIVELALKSDIVPQNKAYLTLMYAADMQNPNTAGWAVNSSAPVAADAANSTLDTRGFNDTTEMGIGFMAAIPADATMLNLTLKGRPESAPSSAANNSVAFKLYAKQIPSDAAVGSWDAGTVLTAFSLPLQTHFHAAVLSQTLASLGLVANTTYQFELTRVGTNAGDTLVGNFNLLEVLLELV